MLRDVNEIAVKEFLDVKTMTDLLDCAAEFNGNKFAFKSIDDQLTEKTITYKEFLEDILKIAGKFESAGLERKHIGIVGKNSYEWILLMMSVIYSNNIAVPIDRNTPFGDLLKISDSVDLELLLYSDELDLKDSDLIDCQISSFSEILKDKDDYYLNKKSNSSEDDVIIIALTSGTTSVPKAVMLSNKNIISVVECSFDKVGYVDCTNISILPFNHTYQLSIATFYYFYVGGCICFLNDQKDFVKGLHIYKPNCLIVVPLVLEMLYKYLRFMITKNGLQEEFLYDLKRSAELLGKNNDERRVIFKKYIDLLGGNLSLVHCGGAPCRDSVIEFFNAIGIDVYAGYGITECSPLVACNSYGNNKLGSVGKPVMSKHCQIKIHDDEIFVRGNIVAKGYYKDEDLNNEAFVNGWFRTGDLGRFDRDGFLYITGRVKNLIILNNGENVSPEELETMLNNYNIVKESMVGIKKSEKNENEYIHARIVLNEETIDNSEQKHLIDSILKDVNSKLAVHKKIQSYEIQTEDFAKNSNGKIIRF